MTPHSPSRGRDAGFTLVELLVVMVVVGILAAIAVPSLVSQRGKARETAAKSDVKALTKEVLGYYVDGTGPLTLTSSNGTWVLSSTTPAATVATGRLSPTNAVTAATTITSDNAYCVAVSSSTTGARPWHADQTGLAAGDC